MNPFSWLASEWKTVLRSPKTYLSLIGVMFIPVLYSGVYLWAFWDPYAHIERIPVAVVNEDLPFSYEDKTYAIGNGLVNEFKRDRSFAWDFVDRKQADLGLVNNDYYFSIMIPEDFSERAATLTANRPTPLELTVKTNEGLNFAVAKIGQTGVEQIRQELSDRLSKNYAEMIFHDLEPLKEGMEQASKGASQLNQGLHRLETGTSQMLEGVKAKQAALSQLDRGAAELDLAVGKLAADFSNLAAGLSQTAAGLKPLLESAEFSGRQLEQGLKQISVTSQSLNDGLMRYISEHPEAGNDRNFAGLSSDALAVANGAAQLNQSTEGLNAAIAGIRNKPEMESGIAQIADRLKQFPQEAAELSRGTHSLASAVHELRVGWDSLVAGLEGLSEGEAKLAAGSGRLSDSLADGAGRLNRLHASQALYDMIANPVRVKEEWVNKLPNYGTGMAPFFLSVSLYVGALLLSTVYPLRTTASPPPSGIVWGLSKYSVLALVSTGQVLIMTVIVTQVVGLEPTSLLYFVLFSLFTSLVFMSFIQFLVTAGDNAGRFAAVILLVLQLSATSGTFPVELVPRSLQMVHAFLPITYTIEGYRSIISTGRYETLANDIRVLSFFGAASIILTMVLLTLRLRRKSHGV
ncbi:YhgE/Pip domain-containing protein [Paenibacillus sp. sptzw28]|uniref:YhgE/Pip domain-containing protein n=1 Tax=Paenibacillus sp. sptzw28 TaxID=715179 RepID=UPI001C6EB330|nr:YhgE/Pip domain-containing protein [Paenibacillus sp. sptzw28]QYR23178.1 YhgE/Pip domain-containing protein [Paenibacillus sp. sptzw28]